MPTIQASTLEEFGTSLFVGAGVSPDESRIVARSLVEANLRGHDSHGVMRIPFYIGSLKEGRLKPGAPLDVLNETAAVLACDGGWGFGQVQARRLMELLIPKALALGVACGTICRSGHIGRVGEYAEMAAEKGLALVAFANTHGARPRVSPPGGKSPRLGTNPLCVGVPADGTPVVLDFGTSATAEGKVRVLRIAGKTCPPGWLVDSDGNPTTDPNQLYVDPPGSILPMGGDQAYKGFGLSLVIDMLAGGLSGGLCARADAEPPLGNDAVFILLEPDHFRGRDHFAREVEGVSAYVRGCPPIKAGAKILLPGDPERNTLEQRRARGIPLDEGNWQPLVDLAGRLNVPPPSL